MTAETQTETGSAAPPAAGETRPTPNAASILSRLAFSVLLCLLFILFIISSAQSPRHPFAIPKSIVYPRAHRGSAPTSLHTGPDQDRPRRTTSTLNSLDLGLDSTTDESTIEDEEGREKKILYNSLHRFSFTFACCTYTYRFYFIFPFLVLYAIDAGRCRHLHNGRRRVGS